MLSELFQNFKKVFSDCSKRNFLLKLIIVFLLILSTNYIFDRIDNDELKKTFQENPYIIIKIPNNTMFKIIIIFIFVIFGFFIYHYLIKPNFIS